VIGRGVATLLAVSMVGVLALGPEASRAALAQEDERIDRAAQVLGRFLSDPGNAGMREALKRARAVLVVPSYVRAGFVIGGTGGGGVMLVRKPEGGGWNGPAFYDTAAGTLGPQLGVYKTELVMLFMSERSVERALAGEMQFGADASVAAGPVGAGEKGPWADIYTYVKPVGAYAGVSVSSGAVEPDRGENEEFYGRGATARGILVDGRYNDAKGEKLRRLLTPY
jgi:lipid-binding SYLF domain-containing protein